MAKKQAQPGENAQPITTTPAPEGAPKGSDQGGEPVAPKTNKVKTPKAKPGSVDVVLGRRIALGNGTRAKGERVGTCPPDADPSLDAAGVTFDKGLDPVEVETLTNNPALMAVAT